MPQTIQDVIREQDNDSRASKGKSAESDAGFAKSQEDSADRLRKYAAKGGGRSVSAPTRDEGESLGDFAARSKKFKQTQQDAQASALSK